MEFMQINKKPLISLKKTSVPTLPSFIINSTELSCVGKNLYIFIKNNLVQHYTKACKVFFFFF